jgi:hypothetical protein
MSLIWHPAASSLVLKEHLGSHRFKADGDVGIAMKHWLSEKDTF